MITEWSRQRILIKRIEKKNEREVIKARSFCTQSHKKQMNNTVIVFWDNQLNDRNHWSILTEKRFCRIDHQNLVQIIDTVFIQMTSIAIVLGD